MRPVAGVALGNSGGIGMTIDLPRAVEEFWAARARGEPFPADYFNRLSLDEAYHIQLALIDRRCAAGERQIGWKVGLTSRAIQQQFGFSRALLWLHPGDPAERACLLGRGTGQAGL
jgi:hypothetical protein